MDLTDFSNGKIWAITESNLQAMLDRLPEISKKESAAFKEDPDGYDDFKLRDGVAIIPVTGPIMKRGSFFSFLYGGSPLTHLNDLFTSAIEQKDVEAIVFDFDTPGGAPEVEAFAETVFKYRGVKPMVSFASGMMTSAGYWAGSAANKIVVSKTADVGNIGVLMIHTDTSKMDSEIGIKRTFIKSGKYKALGNDSEPLSDLALKTFTAELEYVHGLFIDTALTRNRKMKTFLDEGITEAKIYIGQQAVDVGLADKVGSLDTAIELAQSMIKPKNTFYFKTGVMATVNAKKETYKMTDIKKEATIESVKDLELAVPNLVKEIQEKAVAGLDIDKKVLDAVAAEKGRVVGIAVEMLGEENGTKFQAIIDQGLTLEQFQAVKGVIGAEKKTEKESPEATAQAEALKVIQEASAENPGSGGQVTKPGDMDFMAIVSAYQSENKCTRTEALRAIAAQNPESHKRFLAKQRPEGTA